MTDFTCYMETLTTLFKLLEQANQADSAPIRDGGSRAPWQHTNDISAFDGNYYGQIRGAIVAIAGEEIIEHWADTGEVDGTKANRLFDHYA